MPLKSAMKQKLRVDFSVTVDKFLQTETARHAREQKVCQVSGYEWESNSEAESIKDVDDINMLLHWKQKIINLTTLSSLVAP